MNTENGPACEPEMSVLNAGVRARNERKGEHLSPLFQFPTTIFWFNFLSLTAFIHKLYLQNLQHSEKRGQVEPRTVSFRLLLANAPSWVLAFSPVLQMRCSLQLYD